VAAVAHLSEAHFILSFRAVFGETPHRYLRRRRMER
jgi:AraC-like DNA-binding protein